METLVIKIPDDKSLLVKQVLKEFGVTIIKTELNGNVLNLSPEQKEEIISSQDQISKNLIIAQSALDDEIELWLKQ